MIDLREYQQDAVLSIIHELESESTALLVAATGLGKTRIFIAFIERILECNPDLKIMIIVNKVNLLQQTIRSIKELLPNVDVRAYCASTNQKDLSATITVATIQSVTKKSCYIDVCILDEIHRVNQDEGMYISLIKKFRSVNSNLKILGVSATPFRATGYIYGKDKMFKRICYEKGLLWAIENNFLVYPKCKHTNERFDTSNLHVKMGEFRVKEVELLTSDITKLKAQVADAIPHLADRRKTVWATSSIRHCNDVYSELTRIGESVTLIHSKLSSEEIDYNTFEFENGSTKNLVFVNMASEGWDYPPADSLCILRPTRSSVLMVQLCGRVLRPCEGKEDALILDYGEVFLNCGTLDKPIVGKKGKNRKGVSVNAKFCPKCYSYLNLDTKICPDCDYSFNSFQDRDYQKNLTFKSSEAVILSTLIKKPESIDRIVNRVKISIHIAKSGNKCLKVSYACSYPANEVIHEYFSISNMKPWMRDKLNDRLDIIGAELPQYNKDLDYQGAELWKGEAHLKLKTEIKDGYSNVKKAIRI
jgi:DNA repair protein RadD